MSNIFVERQDLATPDHHATQSEPGKRTQRTRARPGRPAGNNASPAILQAAKLLFLEAGFDGVNLERVGEAAGVTRQTVYNLFGSKEAVFRAMVGLHWDEISRDSAAVLSTSLDPVLGPAAILRGFGEAIVRFIDGTQQVAFTPAGDHGVPPAPPGLRRSSTGWESSRCWRASSPACTGLTRRAPSPASVRKSRPTNSLD